MANQTESQPFDFMNGVNWEQTSEVMGRLTGSVMGTYVSQKLALSLGLRVVTVIGGYYSGAFLGIAAYTLAKEVLKAE